MLEQLYKGEYPDRFGVITKLLREKYEVSEHDAMEAVGLEPGDFLRFECGQIARRKDAYIHERLPRLMELFHCATLKEMVNKAVGYAACRAREFKGINPGILAQALSMRLRAREPVLPEALLTFENTGEGFDTQQIHMVCDLLGYGTVTALCYAAVDRRHKKPEKPFNYIVDPAGRIVVRERHAPRGSQTRLLAHLRGGTDGPRPRIRKDLLEKSTNYEMALTYIETEGAKCTAVEREAAKVLLKEFFGNIRSLYNSVEWKNEIDAADNRSTNASTAVVRAANALYAGALEHVIELAKAHDARGPGI